MTEQPLLLDQASEAVPEDMVGLKTAQLFMLSRRGIPVPRAICVTAAAHFAFLKESNMVRSVQELVSHVNWADINSIHETAIVIHGYFAQCPIPFNVAHAVEESYRARFASVPVAVRSSAIAEDRAADSFAGQQQSRLNIKSLQGLFSALRECWSSPWSERAIVYRHLRHLDSTSILTPALIQEMIMADVAGIAFTVNPITGNEDELVINSSWGIGDSVTSGDIEPDQICVDKNTGEIRTIYLGSKTHMSVGTMHEGTKLVRLDRNKSGMISLSGDQVRVIKDNACTIEQIFRQPLDIEWAFVDGQLWVLQVRAVTAMAKRNN